MVVGNATEGDNAMDRRLNKRSFILGDLRETTFICRGRAGVFSPQVSVGYFYIPEDKIPEENAFL